MLRRFVLLVVLAASFGPAAAAHAQRCEAPPGTAAVDQYCESIPKASGTTSGSKFNRGGVAGETASGGTGARLAAEGADGVALATFVSRTRPPGPRGGGSGQAAQDESASLGAPSNSLVAAIRSSTGAGDTTGLGFVVALLAIALLVGGLVVAKRRRGTED